MRAVFAAGLLAWTSASCSAPAEGDPSARLDDSGSPYEVLNVAFLVVDGVYNTELTAPLDIFQHTVFHVDAGAEPAMRVFTVAETLQPITTFEGLRLLPDFTYAAAPRVDVLVVPSGEHSMDSDLEDEALMSWVRRAGVQARFVMSLCDGAFVLAQAGLLEGLECTTFPSDIPRLREMFPQLTVHEDVSFVHHGRALTSVGGARSFDLALYLCEELYGAEVARRIARGLVIDWDVDAIPRAIVP